MADDVQHGGSLQVGSASRFKSKTVDDGYSPNVSTAQLMSPPATGDFKGLRIGPEFEIELEGNQAQPIDGSKDLLRVVSPFMIQAELPLIVGSNPGTDKKNYSGIYNAGHRNAPTAWRAGRDKYMQDLPGGDRLTQGGSTEQVVSNGVRTMAAGGDQTRTVSLSPDTSGSRLGTPAIADLKAAADIEMQLRAIVKTPPLVLLINPESLATSFTKIQQFSDRTRYGFVFQAWGEEQPKLSISAKCGAFISGGRGVQFASRLDSAAWQNVQSVFLFYKHNGYIYDTVGKSNANHMVGALSIHYDGWVYYGNMESFTYTLDEKNQQGGITFAMEFTVNAMVDTSKQAMIVSPMMSPTPSRSDPRYSALGGGATPNEGDYEVDVGAVVSRAAPSGAKNTAGALASVSPDGQSVPRSTRASGRVSPKGTGGFVKAGG